MIEQDGLLFNPIPYIPQEQPSSHTTVSAQSLQPSLESAEALLYKQYADQLYKTHIQGYPTYSQNSYLRDSTQPSTSIIDRFTAPENPIPTPIRYKLSTPPMQGTPQIPKPAIIPI